MKKFEIDGNKIRINLHLKLWKDKKMIFSIACRKKSTIRRSIEANTYTKAYLRVSYLKDFYNSGYYNNKKDVLSALSAFTEKPLLDFVK